jgi:type II secretory pathway component PulC
MVLTGIIQKLIFSILLVSSGLVFASALHNLLTPLHTVFSTDGDGLSEILAEEFAPTDRGVPVERAWPALFGEPAPPAPATPEAADPPPDYVLRGLVTSDAQRWAIVTAGGQDLLVREEDELEGGWTVESIRADGLTLALGERRTRIEFDDDLPVRTVEVEEVDLQETGRPRPQRSIRTPVASPTELRDMILRAERERQIRGLVPVERSSD